MAIPPPARCQACKQEFSSKKEARRHAIAAGHTGPVGYFCRECDEHFGMLGRYNNHISATGHTQLRLASTLELSTHRGTAHLKPYLSKMCARCGEEVPMEDAHLKCLANPIICPICRLRFANGEELAYHVVTVSSCMSCGICLRPSETLADHLWTSEAHPKCIPCKLGFYKMDELDQHQLLCEALHFVKSPAPGDVLPSTTESSLTTHVNTPFIVLDAWSFPQSPQNHIPGHGEDSEVPSWHCRSCLQNPCVDPVATICGHLFCHECLVQEFSERSCCPVCEKPFYVRLHAES
ncbi:hypothetical protein V8D89_008240 [Ganoderma adspersum]